MVPLWAKSTMYQTVVMVTIQKIFTSFVFSETFKGNSKTLPNMTLVQPSVDEIVGGGGGPDDPPLV